MIVVQTCYQVYSSIGQKMLVIYFFLCETWLSQRLRQTEAPRLFQNPPVLRDNSSPVYKLFGFCSSIAFCTCTYPAKATSGFP